MPNQDQIQRLLAEMLGGTNLPAYPTKEEILENPPTHKPLVIQLVKEWKKTIWFPARVSEPNAEEKFLLLKMLLQRIAVECYQKPVEVVYNAESRTCYHEPQLNRITINKSLSILSSLHELGHHLFGPSELKACRWSVHLFKKAFPKAYSGLVWKGHMLVKPETCSVS